MPILSRKDAEKGPVDNTGLTKRQSKQTCVAIRTPVKFRTALLDTEFIQNLLLLPLEEPTTTVETQALK